MHLITITAFQRIGKLFLLYILLFCVSFSAPAADFSLSSPNGQNTVTISDQDGEIRYALVSNGKEVVRPSGLTIFPGTPATIKDASKNSENSSWEPIWGQFSEVVNQYNGLVLNVEMTGIKAMLHVRLYNQGVGFRYELEGYPEGNEAQLLCEYRLDNTDALYCPQGEDIPLGPLLVRDLNSFDQKLPQLHVPMVIQKSEKLFLSILESDLFSAQGFGVMDLEFDVKQGLLFSSNKVKLKGKKTITPWRVILLGQTAGDLVTSTVPLNLAAPLQIKDASWIKPGKTLWDWRVHGYTAPDGFNYGINTESYFRFIDFASDKGIEYFLIDDSWYKKASLGYFELSEKLDLKKVIDYAENKGVKLILYYDRRHGEYGDKELFQYYRSIGMKGIKYGFMKDNVPFTRKAIKESAKNHLLIDFHDSPVPMTGVRRTFPNAITREYCHAQQDARKAFTPETFIKMALINAIQGPLDMNNGNFDLKGINSGIRQKGPKIPKSYWSTVVSEAARTLIIFSGLVCLPDAPEAYRQKSDLFEFIQKQPVGKWNETRIINSKIGAYITTARRYGEEWFVGSVIDQNGGTLDINLDFLDSGQEYEATFYEDGEDANCQTNPEAYVIKKGTVIKDQLIKAKLAPGGGHCIWIRPINY